MKQDAVVVGTSLWGLNPTLGLNIAYFQFFLRKMMTNFSLLYIAYNYFIYRYSELQSYNRLVIFYGRELNGIELNTLYVSN